MKKKNRKKSKVKDTGFMYSKNNPIYLDARAGMKIDSKRIKNTSDVAAALAGILDS